jgi:hypothetical protein
MRGTLVWREASLFHFFFFLLIIRFVLIRNGVIARDQSWYNRCSRRTSYLASETGETIHIKRYGETARWFMRTNCPVTVLQNSPPPPLFFPRWHLIGYSRSLRHPECIKSHFFGFRGPCGRCPCNEICKRMEEPRDKFSLPVCASVFGPGRIRPCRMQMANHESLTASRPNLFLLPDKFLVSSAVATR